MLHPGSVDYPPFSGTPDKRFGCPLSLRFFFFQAEAGIRDLVRSRGLGDVYNRQVLVRRGEGATWLVIKPGR